MKSMKTRVKELVGELDISYTPRDEAFVIKALNDFANDKIDETINILGKYLTHHHHEFRGGVTLCESGYGAPDSQCVIEIIRGLKSV